MRFSHAGFCSLLLILSQLLCQYGNPDIVWGFTNIYGLGLPASLCVPSIPHTFSGKGKRVGTIRRMEKVRKNWRRSLIQISGHVSLRTSSSSLKLSALARGLATGEGIASKVHIWGGILLICTATSEGRYRAGQEGQLVFDRPHSGCYLNFVKIMNMRPHQIVLPWVLKNFHCPLAIWHSVHPGVGWWAGGMEGSFCLQASLSLSLSSGVLPHTLKPTSLNPSNKKIKTLLHLLEQGAEPRKLQKAKPSALSGAPI